MPVSNRTSLKDGPSRIARRIALLTMILAMAVIRTALGQKSITRQIVTLQVMELNKLDLVGGPLKLEIGSINDGAVQPNPATDASTTLCWTSNGNTRKIAVGSNITSPKFILKIEAEDNRNGPWTMEPEITLSDNAPHDLVVGMERSSGSCTLKFTALASVEAGVGSEQHLITYTITGS
jgi:hypothetical protein